MASLYLFDYGLFFENNILKFVLNTNKINKIKYCSKK